MSSKEFEGDWEELKNKIRKEFSELTDKDLKFAEVQKEEMLRRLQVMLGKTHEELQKIINKLNSA